MAIKSTKAAPKVSVRKTDLLIGGKKSVVGYHTMECRESILDAPIKCTDRRAWLGFGYYFWLEEIFAKYWGEDFKIRKNNPKAQADTYDVYTADLNIENCINTVFDEEDYTNFISRIEEAILYFQCRRRPFTLETVHRYLADRVWGKLGISGIIYDDKPTNPKNKKRFYSLIPDLYYKKRIQVVIFDSKNVSKFKLYLENQK